MGTALNSINNMLSQASAKGMLNRCFVLPITAATTVGGTNNGGITLQRYPYEFTVPTLGSGVNGAYMVQCRMTNEDAQTGMICALEVPLGSVNMSTGVFTSGSTMPSRIYNSVSSAVQWASPLVIGVVTTAVTATTPTITVTYTNQAGTGSRSGSYTLPTSPAINSAYLFQPHLQSGDTGIRSISNITKSAGSAGVFTFYGLMPLAFGGGGNVGAINAPDILSVPLPQPLLLGGDIISFYRFGNTTTNNLVATITLLPEN